MAKSKFFNRELSWIEFNARVLSESLRKELPLLERFRFVTITESNFDEFFQVRVASIKRRLKDTQGNSTYKDASGYTDPALLKKIAERTHELVKLEYSTMMSDIIPTLSRNGIVYVPPKEYTQADAAFAENLFDYEIFPLLTPLRTDVEEFPRIGALCINAAFLLEPLPGIQSTQDAQAACLQL